MLLANSKWNIQYRNDNLYYFQCVDNFGRFAKITIQVYPTVIFSNSLCRNNSTLTLSILGLASYSQQICYTSYLTSFHFQLSIPYKSSIDFKEGKTTIYFICEMPLEQCHRYLARPTTLFTQTSTIHSSTQNNNNDTILGGNFHVHEHICPCLHSPVYLLL